MSRKLNTYNQAWRALRGDIQREARKFHAAVKSAIPREWKVSRLYSEDCGGNGYAFTARPKDESLTDTGYDCSLKLLDGNECSGEDMGYAVCLCVTAILGRVMIDYTPDNYTPDVWKRDADEIRASMDWSPDNPADEIARDIRDSK